ncbi:hypothetical protein EDF83_5969 [Pseudomonas protegens]|uniref:hypothetical protein n=2 Tax=Pseudomonas TaxID=286 RepID=UPI000F4A502B|nr:MULTISPECIES: hypothetical protein [Pseudomonas]MCS4261679.1 hypothetical protein [Pseudomonas sp. BIGb0176]ROQ51037.1 hypothetical protein EDF83_5969 [Pseudomonas protegens]ROQ78520.1 hypothetical protein EC837_3694 [Pseudomonas protegens]
MISSPRSASLIGGEAIDLIHSSREHITWLTALLNAVSADVTHGKGHNVKALTGLGQYIGDDWANYLNCQTTELQEKLDALEGNQ